MYFGNHHDLPRKLEDRAKELDKLTTMLDRIKKEDIEGARKALADAAHALDDLMKGELPGCSCRVVDHDNYSYLSYDEKCRHHRTLWILEENLKKRFQAAEKKLLDETRMKLIVGALSSVNAAPGADPQTVAEQAVGIADQVLQVLLTRL